MPSLPRAGVWFTGLFVAVAAANTGVLRALFAFADGNATASHVLIVPAVTLALLFQNRDGILAAGRPARRSGLAVIAAGLAVSALASSLADGSLGIAVLGVVVAWVGAFVFAFGWSAARVALFPLAFLLFTVPPPALVVDGLTEILKRGSTEAVALLFSAVGTPYYREGFVFALPGVTIEIADECSGIRSSIALVLTSLLAGYTFLGRVSSNLLLIAAVLPVAILKNGIRIVTLSLLATNVNPEFLTGQLHQDGGVLFFALSLVILAPVLFFLQRRERMAAASMLAAASAANQSPVGSRAALDHSPNSGS